MKKIVGVLMGAFVMVQTYPPAFAQQAVDVNQVIRELEISGALDKAVAQSLKRLERQRLQEQKRQEAQARKIQAAKAVKARAVNPESDFIFGNPNAEVSIIVYSDFECPYCKRYHDAPKQVAETMGPDVNVVFRNFPLGFHDPVATQEAIAAICAYEQGGSSAFWQYADGVMAKTESNSKGMPGDKPLQALAQQNHLDVALFDRCLQSASARERIQADLQDGEQAGVNGTPATILRNNKTGRSIFLSGAVPKADLQSAVQDLQGK